LIVFSGTAAACFAVRQRSNAAACCCEQNYSKHGIPAQDFLQSDQHYARAGIGNGEEPMKVILTMVGMAGIAVLIAFALLSVFQNLMAITASPSLDALADEAGDEERIQPPEELGNAS
jgi:hypothetical protein